MIYDALDQLETYAALSPAFAAAVRWVRATDLHTLPADGQAVPIDGERVFAIPQTYETFAPDRFILESHRRYHDIQVVLDGEEGMRVLTAGCGVAVTEPYDEKRDVAFYDPSEAGVTTPGVDLVLYPGVFAVLGPNDLHGPNRTLGPTPRRNHKVVIKVTTDT